MENTVALVSSPGMPVSPCAFRVGGPASCPSSRKDSLPEHHHYSDTGCFLHSACLSCPAPACLFEARFGKHTHTTLRRRLFILHSRRHGVPWRVIARFLGISLRSAYRTGRPWFSGPPAAGEDAGRSLDPLPSTIGRGGFASP